MVTLVEFLLTRIAEDEEAANHAQWAMQSKWFTTADDKVDEFVRRNSPARVLAECDAKRRIVATIQRWLDTGYPTLDHVLFAMALPYADHPDYRPEWRP